MSAKVEDKPQDMVTIEVNGEQIQAPKGSMIIEATDARGVDVPRFCYHKKLPIAANCRMCLVEVEKAPKPLPACATPVADGMKIFTDSPRAVAAQRGVMEFLLINHPLDCPICDQGGECELQDVAMGYGRGVSRFTERKRVVDDEDLGPLISTEMTRCIHCTRCVRFLDHIAGKRELGGMNRGEYTEISTFVEGGVHSELSGNIIDLCPVGALTNKPFRFRARAWELLAHPSVAPHDAVGSNLHLHHLRGEIMRVVPRENELVNETWIADRDRYSHQGVYSEDRITRPLARVDGALREVDWQTALEQVAGLLRETVETHGPAQLGALVGPTTTAEEMYLLGRLVRGLGSRNIDHRLRDGDVSDQDQAPAFPWLGQPISALEDADAALLVGSYLRHEQPILNHRLRKATKAGATVFAINNRRYDFNYDLAEEILAGPSAQVGELAAVLQAVVTANGGTLPEGADALYPGKPDARHQAIAEQLSKAERATILLGNQANAHPQAALLRALSAELAEQTGAVLGVLPEAANTVGGYLAGAVPHREVGGVAADKAGLDARSMLAEPRKAYVLYNVEPELDCWNGQQARAALASANRVIAFSSWLTPELEREADVILPIAAFGETSGTFVNLEGRWQSFPGVGKPVGEARPGWRVLRVLGNVLELDGFDQESSDEVLHELQGAVGEVAPSNAYPWVAPKSAPAGGEGLERAGATPIYAVDPLVRRSQPLQQTSHAVAAEAWLAPATAERLGVDEGGQIRLGSEQVELPVRVSADIAEGTVWVPAALRESVAVGPMNGELEVAGH
ncbi:NADH dehydrogenase subunit G [Alkalispirillum mobile]|uniref:NADH-quinone oxidoreductase n=1 Tax=Alkalispirillum mobile TaxID=85925 RepID=A0A498C656_9GAMM|nr:NADH-quinone oxidoreductase subunit NuoG [Alkalispirillum mobile]RLK50823.1 NADH dehydrogenase subunit G [Alkalispirillum mobile]